MGEVRLYDAAAEERQPLLQQQQQQQQQSSELYETHRQLPPPRRKRSWQKLIPRFDVVAPRYRFVPLLGCLIIVFNESESMFKQVAMIRAYEAMHCIEYYQKHDPNLAELGKHIPEKFCKTDEIQKHVATTAAVQLFIRLLCSMIGNLPLGWVADKYGRKVVLSLHKLNIVCSGALRILFYMLYPTVPIWAMYLSGIPGLIGGNFDLGLAMLFVSYTDVMNSEAQRTTLLFLTTAMQYPAQAVAPLLSGMLMDLDGQGTTPEVAMFVGFACGTISAILTVFFFPETIGESRKVQVADDSHTRPNNDGFDDASKEASGIGGKLHKKLHTLWRDTQNSVRGIGVRNMFLLCLSILTAAIGIKSINWFGLVQYPVIKFHWMFSQSTIAVSVQAVIIIINYTVLLPFYTRLGTQRLQLSTARTSLVIMLFSTFLLISGSIGIGFSATVPAFFFGLLVYTLGGGLPVATQVYISCLVEKTKLAHTLASLSVATIAGKVLASVIFPKMMAAGLDDGRDWIKGLPMFTSACLFVVAGLTIIIAATTMGEKPTRQVNEESEGTS